MSAFKIAIRLAAIAALFLVAPVQATGSDTRAMLDFNSCAKPHYPAESLAAKHQGVVDLSFLVDANGVAQDAKIVKSSGHDLLDVAARDAIKLCKFVPAKKDGQYVETWAKIQYVWTLK